jgi:hypothetical protein
VEVEDKSGEAALVQPYFSNTKDLVFFCPPIYQKKNDENKKTKITYMNIMKEL